MNDERARRTRVAILAVIALSGLLRWGLWIVNPPNNSYDDYMTPIRRYAMELERPAAADCWECYQPPAYFVAAAAVARIVLAVHAPEPMAWKLIQLLGAILSVVAVWIVSRTLLLWFPRSPLAVLAGVCLVAMLPRDLYTSAMITNDTLLGFFVALAVYSYSRVVKRGEALGVLWLGVATVGACWTKQSGLITLLLPLALCWRHPRPLRRWVVACLIAAALLGPADEVVRFGETGVFLASNQDFFPQASGQRPGSLAVISFTDLQLPALLNHPFLSARTMDSFWTQLFARAWFDFEARFFAPGPAATRVAAAAFTIGLLYSLLALFGAARSALRVRVDTSLLALHLLGLAFLAVPLIQTLRFPYYSSMKAMFVLPSLSIVALWVAAAAEWLSTRAAGRWIVILLVAALSVFAVVHLLAVAAALPESLTQISGPIWRIPQLR